MKVCIAEKPSVAREIASVLGANTKRDGYFEGNGYAVTYTFGHLCTLKEPNDYKPHWKSWDVNNLPMLPEKFETKVVANSGIQKQFKIVKSLFDKAEVVINCGDAGQEGELIQRWAAACARSACARWKTGSTRCRAVCLRAPRASCCACARNSRSRCSAAPR